MTVSADPGRAASAAGGRRSPLASSRRDLAAALPATAAGIRVAGDLADA